MNVHLHVFAPKHHISAQFGYNFSRQTDLEKGIAYFRPAWLRICSGLYRPLVAEEI